MKCTSFRQRIIEDALDDLAAAPVTPTHAAVVLTGIRAEDFITAHMLHTHRHTDIIKSEERSLFLLKELQTYTANVMCYFALL